MNSTNAVVKSNKLVSTDGSLLDITGLGKKAQKSKLLSLFIQAQDSILTAHTKVEQSKKKAKSLRRAIANSDAGKKLIELGKEKNLAIREIDQMELKINHLVEFAESLGIEIRADLKKLVSVEVSE